MELLNVFGIENENVIFLLTGRFRVGKTNLTNILKKEMGNREVLITHFAKKLKEYAKQLGIEKTKFLDKEPVKFDIFKERFNNTITDIEVSEDDIKNLYNIYLKCYEDPESNGRKFLQYLGTEIVRKRNPDYWVLKVIEEIKEKNPNIVIIDDFRFPNEDLSKYKEITDHYKVIKIRVEPYDLADYLKYIKNLYGEKWFDLFSHPSENVETLNVDYIVKMYKGIKIKEIFRKVFGKE
jgi:hypothetical protein